MHPILFEIGDWPVYSYGVLLAAAYLAGGFIHRAQLSDEPPQYEVSSFQGSADPSSVTGKESVWKGTLSLPMNWT